jgi:ABC-type antimicrobial peptide transport system permease subunit
MFAILGPALLLMAAIGIYAVVAYAVSQRTKEIGVRLALGATTGRVVSQIVTESLRFVVAGAAVGWIVALGFNSHLLRGPVYLSVFAGVPALLLAVATLACWLPARRASGLDPIAALRQE